MAWPELAALADAAVLGTYAETVTHTPAGGAPLSRRGVFDAEASQLGTVGGVEVESQGPELFIRLSEWTPEPARDDAVTVRGTAYVVRTVRPDGQGGARVPLREP